MPPFRAKYHPLVIAHGSGGPVTGTHVSDWLRAVEGNGSRVVVLPPDYHDWIAAAQGELEAIQHGGVDVREHVEAALSALDNALEG